jgi:heme/copper-type cytochrome/quinol oxidase subunit 2
MRSANAYLVAAFVIAFSVLLIIPLWAIYGVLLPHDGHGHAHGVEETVKASEFEAKTAAFIKAHQLPDGSVRADPGVPIYVVARQYTFVPNTIRLKVGEQYDMQMLSTDVVHAFSVQMGNTSYNAVLMPNIVAALTLTPRKPGTYLIVCSEYCGLGHDYMYFSIVVEEGEAAGAAQRPEAQHGEVDSPAKPHGAEKHRH